MTENTDDILSKLPARLKEARRAQGLSLEAVANLSGVSRSMVSQIERGESSPTIATLWNLTRALQVDFAGLLDGETGGDRIDVLNAKDLPSIENRDAGCRIRILSPPEEVGQHELYEIGFEAGGRLDSQPHRAGTREQLIVISGRIEVRSGSATAVIEEGGTARYAADVAHCITALESRARAFLTVKNA